MSKWIYSEDYDQYINLDKVCRIHKDYYEEVYSIYLDAHEWTLCFAKDTDKERIDKLFKDMGVFIQS